MSNLLFECRPVLIIPELACSIGVNEAIFVQQIHYWTVMNAKNGSNYRGGHFWSYNTYKGWKEQFPWISEVTIRRTLKGLERDGLVITGKYNKMGSDQTKWYRLNYEKLGLAEKEPLLRRKINDVTDQNDHMQVIKMITPLPEIKTETNNGNNGRMDQSDKSDRPGGVYLDEEDEDVSRFIKWYFAFYEAMTGELHPPIKSAQKRRVHEVLKDFCNEYCVDSDGLKAMSEAFFNVAGSDHNINHFATEGILENRFYEELY